jgi:rhodanese-related sulfurtransferase
VTVFRIELSELQRLIGAGAQLVEALPAPEYAEAHLPGAINIAIESLDGDTTAGLDRARAVALYCHDYL